jgi:hypothetical protein
MKEQHNQQEFDDVFRQTFGEAEVSPSSDVWTNVEAQLDGKPKRRPGAWLWFGLGLFILLSGLGVTYHLLSDTSTQPALASNRPAAHALSKSVSPDSSRTAPQSTATATETQPEKTNSTENSSAQDKSAVKTEGETPASTSESTPEKSVARSSVAQKTKTTSVSSDQVDVSSSSAMSHHPTQSKAEPRTNVTSPKTLATELNTPVLTDSKTASNASTAEKIAVKPVNTPQPVQEIAGKSSLPVSGGSKKEETIGTSSAAQSVPPANVDQHKNEESESASTAVAKKPETVPAVNPEKGAENKTTPSTAGTPVKKDSLPLAKKEDSLKPNLSKPPVSTSAASTDSLSKSIYLISISGFGSPELNLGENSPNSSALSGGSEVRNPRVASGLKAGIAFRDKLEISIGCAYSQVNQEFAPQTFYFPRQLNGQPFIFNSSFGDMSVPASTMLSGYSPLAPPSITQFRARYQYTQTIQYLNIPIEATLHFGHKRLGFFVSGGLNLQYAFSEKATLELLKENETDRIDYSSLQVQKLNYALQLGLGVEFKFTKHLGVYLEPNGRYNFLPQSTNTTIKSTNYFVGSAAGLKYTF